MTIGGVGADEEKRVGQLDIRIASRRPVAPKRERHRAGGAAHAQSAIAVYMVGAKIAFAELVKDILGFGGKLSG